MPLVPLVVTVLVVTVTANAVDGEPFDREAVSGSGPALDLVESAPLAFAFDPGLTSAMLVALLPQEEEAAERAPDAHDEGIQLGDEIPGPVPYGAKGTKRWNIHVNRGREYSETSNNFFSAGIGFSDFIEDGLSLDVEFDGIHVDQKGGDQGGVNLTVLLRWHAIMERSWTFYLDAGMGLLVTSDNVPENGSSFNFTPQAGAGFSIDLGGDVRLLTGFRWHHISNANLYSDNPGRDNYMGYVGFSFPF